MWLGFIGIGHGTLYKTFAIFCKFTIIEEGNNNQPQPSD